ncbi:MAG: OmpA family protein [Nannocystaceae bacterium]
MMNKHNTLLAIATIASIALTATPAAAQQPEASESVSVDAAAPAPEAQPEAQPASEEPAAAASDEVPWIRRYRPQRNQIELGIYGGLFFPSAEHELYDPMLMHQPYGSLAPDFGVRAGYYPLRFLGIELEGGVMPTRSEDGESAFIYKFSPVLLAQLPYRIAPFVRAGFGLLGASTTSLGGDIDPSLNIGGGVKFYVNRWLALRLDVVDNVATRLGVGNRRSNNLEVLLGLSFVLNRKKDKRPALIDTDGDTLYDPGQPGVLDSEADQCPLDPGPVENRGCPWIDSDGDGMYDPGQTGVPENLVDSCPNEPGPVENIGCPLRDTDGDGLYDPGQPAVSDADTDMCPDQPGPRENRGCPWPDSDGDGIIDNDDKCPNEPENVNGFEDRDGCPDELPKELKKFSGVIKGIYFDSDKDTIKKRSIPVLQRAVKVLKDFPDIAVEISGHTDTDGTREHNLDLSKRRAEAVKTYLVGKGLDASRLRTKGYGPDQPIESNKTRKGKAKNRRIEFRLVQ